MEKRKERRRGGEQLLYQVHFTATMVLSPYSNHSPSNNVSYRLFFFFFRNNSGISYLKVILLTSPLLSIWEWGWGDHLFTFCHGDVAH